MSLARGVRLGALIDFATPVAARAAIALPDGAAVIVPNDDLAAVRLRADGSLEPSFGCGAIAHIDVPGGVCTARQILRQPGGRIVVVGTGADEPQSEIPRFLSPA